MQANAWVSLLKHIPPQEHTKLVLVTSSGSEICIQAMLRIDQEFMAIKGRLSGSQEQGRVFFLPYAHIDYLGYMYSVKDEDYNAIYGTLETAGIQTPAVPAPPLVAQTNDPPPPVPSSPAQTVEETVPAGSRTSVPTVSSAAPEINTSKTVLTIKSAALERFRARNSGNGSSPGTTKRPPADG
jgi:hypothetical protein